MNTVSRPFGPFGKALDKGNKECTFVSTENIEIMAPVKNVVEKVFVSKQVYKIPDNVVKTPVGVLEPPIKVQNKESSFVSKLPPIPSKSDKKYTVKISNLNDDTNEKDIRSLCEKYGRINRLIMHKKNDIFTGTVFVDYKFFEDADHMIKSLNGYGYNHTIISLEWAK